MNILPSSSRSFTLINFIIGIIITVVLSMLLVLGLRIFIPSPEYPNYNAVQEKCSNTTDPSCYQREQENSRIQQESYQKKLKEYSGRIFIGANILGLILLLTGIIIFSLGLGTNIGAGTILAGGFGIAYGYTLGWAGADDAVKFIFGLVIAILVIIGAVMVNRMRNKATSVHSGA